MDKESTEAEMLIGSTKVSKKYGKYMKSQYILN